eukprot:9721581-Alexandrium_andersonii.AAC.1
MYAGTAIAKFADLAAKRLPPELLTRVCRLAQNESAQSLVTMCSGSAGLELQRLSRPGCRDAVAARGPRWEFVFGSLASKSALPH